MNNQLVQPTPEIILHYIRCFREDNYAADSDIAIAKLLASFPQHTSLDDVLLKVTIINRLYSTNIYAVYPMAQQIVKLNIDPCIQSEDLEIVMKIAELNFGEKTRHFYSFATKYCSWHNQTCYPIYDSFVDILLRAYRQKDGFANFRNSDLTNYPQFKGIVQQFQKFYGLLNFSFKELDKSLWIYGKEYTSQ